MARGKTIDQLGTSPSEKIITWLEQEKKGLEFLEKQKAPEAALKTTIEVTTPNTSELEKLFGKKQSSKTISEFAPPKINRSSAFNKNLIPSIGDYKAINAKKEKLSSTQSNKKNQKILNDFLATIATLDEDCVYIKTHIEEFHKG